MSTAPANTTAATAPTKGQQVDARLTGLEEDDEFEEFAAEDWKESEENKTDANQWDDNWDDDDVEEDFSKQLRAELESIKHKRAVAAK